jgi:cytochrome c oxidase subunit 4
MEHNTQSEITIHHEPASSTRRIWKTFWILLGLTMIELALGFSIYFFEGLPSWIHLLFKGMICILTLAKAFYIVSIFMHLGDEIRNMVMAVVVPLMLFVWFIGAFLWDGNSYRTQRNRYDVYKREKTLERTRPLKAGDTTQHGFGG